MPLANRWSHHAGERHLYRVFLRSPENLVHVDYVQRTLDDNPSVATVTSLLSYVRAGSR